ncbi:MAG: hypothetical protein H0V36_00995 [Chloroflexi bacterium]|nr:hypothetical protein [Chloroflexota bacterium]
MTVATKTPLGDGPLGGRTKICWGSVATETAYGRNEATRCTNEVMVPAMNRTCASTASVRAPTRTFTNASALLTSQFQMLTRILPGRFAGVASLTAAKRSWMAFVTQLAASEQMEPRATVRVSRASALCGAATVPPSVARSDRKKTSTRAGIRREGVSSRSWPAISARDVAAPGESTDATYPASNWEASGWPSCNAAGSVMASSSSCPRIAAPAHDWTARPCVCQSSRRSGEATLRSATIGSTDEVLAKVPMPARASASMAASVVSWLYAPERRRPASAQEASSVGASAPVGASAAVSGDSGGRADRAAEADTAGVAEVATGEVEGRSGLSLAVATSGAVDDGRDVGGADEQPMIRAARTTLRRR